MIRMVFSATLPTIDALTAGVSSPPSFSYSAARETSHSFFGVDKGAVHIPQDSLHDAFTAASKPAATAPDSVSAAVRS